LREAANVTTLQRQERLVLQMSAIGKLLLKVSIVAAYFALVVALYWMAFMDAASVAVIVGLLFLFKTVVDSGAISIGHLSSSDPKSNVGTARMELLKTLSFLGVGLGVWVDFAKALEQGLVPPNVPTAIIHITLVCTFTICVVCCFVRFVVATSNRS
jgi:hypothetical protein